METRNFEVRSVSEEERTVEGIAVPYGDTIDLGGISERFERGAFGEPVDVKLFYDHKEPIGRIESTRDTDEGFVIRARISNTPRGNEVYTLLRDGVLNKFSVGFVPVEDRYEGDVIIRTKADLKEVSVVAFPAYSNAAVSQVRAAENTTNSQEDISNMSKDIEAPEMNELRDAVENLERKYALLGETKTEVATGPQFRSFGEYVKAVAAGDEKAIQMHRAYTGATTADTVSKDAWVGSVVRLVEDNRRVLNAFDKGQLPSEGLNVEYAKLAGNTINITEVAEGADLPFGKVSITTETAPLKVYGGYTEMTRLEIERSSVNIVDTSFQAMAIDYAKKTNAAVRAALVAATGTNAAVLEADTAAGWLGLVIDASADLDDEGLSPEFIMVSRDVFKRLATLTDTAGRPVLDYGQGSNTAGSANAAGLTATLAGVPVIVDAGAAANTCYVGNSFAVKTFESGGAPFQLQDENVINLSKQFSVYGYLAVAVQAPKALVKCDVDLIA